MVQRYFRFTPEHVVAAAKEQIARRAVSTIDLQEKGNADQ
jgi:hypothetical protein